MLEALFDRMPMGIAIFDRELRLVRCNPTWAEFVERWLPGYPPEAAERVMEMIGGITDEEIQGS